MKDHKDIIKELINKGHSMKRAEEIYDEAIQSSNPAYILNYYGCNIKEDDNIRLLTAE